MRPSRLLRNGNLSRTKRGKWQGEGSARKCIIEAVSILSWSYGDVLVEEVYYYRICIFLCVDFSS